MSKRLPRLLSVAILAALACAAISAAPASAAFGLKDLDVTFTNQDGSVATQAGAHPFAMTTSFAVNTKSDPEFPYEIPDGDIKDLTISQIPGLVGTPTATPRCSTLEFLGKACPASSQVGMSDVVWGDPNNHGLSPVYNLIPPPGVAAKLGFEVANQVPVSDRHRRQPQSPLQHRRLAAQHE